MRVALTGILQLRSSSAKLFLSPAPGGSHSFAPGGGRVFAPSGAREDLGRQPEYDFLRTGFFVVPLLRMTEKNAVILSASEGPRP